MRRRRAMAAVAALALAARRPGGGGDAGDRHGGDHEVLRANHQAATPDRSLTAIPKSAQSRSTRWDGRGGSPCRDPHRQDGGADRERGAVFETGFLEADAKVDFRDVRVGSICDGAAMYGQTLFVRPEDLSGIKLARHGQTGTRAGAPRRGAAGRGRKGWRRPTSRSQSITKPAPPTNWRRRAQRRHRRMRVADEGLVLLARAATRRNQLLAAQLGVQAAMAAAAGLPVETYAGANFKAQAASAAGGWAKPDAEGPKP